LFATDLAKNPWHVAKSRADKTGVVVADLMARTRQDRFVLIGHSLGARVMAVAIQSLGTSTSGPSIQAAHLTGAAIGASGDWSRLIARVDDPVYNYCSTNDKVQKYLYATEMGSQKAAGSVGFASSSPRLKNIDVSKKVAKHSDYYEKVQLQWS
jgi:pimeloyl-ACP methyl ester carboxylesterase